MFSYIKFSIIFLLLINCGYLFGQIDYNNVILPENSTNITFEDLLVQTAWSNNPIKNISEKNIEISQHKVNISKASWLEQVRINTNINEFVINPTSEEQRNRAEFFPLYNIGVSINLGMFVTNPQQVKISKLEKDKAIENEKLQKLSLRAQILSLYYDYELANKLFEIQTELTENTFNSYTLVEQQFRDGEINVEEFNNAYNQYKNQLSQKLGAERDLKTIIVQIEEIIGVDFNDLLNSYKNL